MKKIIITLVCLGLISCSKSTPEIVYTDAIAAINAGNPQEAEILLKKGIQDFDGSPTLRLALAKLYLQEDRPDFAESQLDRLIKMSYDIQETIPLFVDSLLFQNKLEQVLALNFSNDFMIADETRASIYTKQLFAAVQMGEQDELENIHQSIVNNANSQVFEYAKQLSSLLVNLNDENVANVAESLNSIRFSEFDSVHILGIKALLYSAIQENEKAIQTANDYLTVNRSNPLVYFLLTELYIKEQQLAKASETINEVLAVFPNSQRANYLVGFVAFSNGDYQSALNYLSKIRPTEADFVSYHLLNGLSSYMLGSFENAYRSLIRIERDLPTSHPALKALALTQSIIGRNTESIETLSNIDEFEPEDLGLLVSAISQQNGVPEEQVATISNKLIETAAKATPLDEALVRFSLNNENIEATLIAELEKAPLSNKANYAAVYYYFSINENEKALSVAKNWVENSKGADEKALNMLATTYLILGEFESAKANFASSLELSENNLNALLGFADTFYQESNLSEAEKYYKKALSVEPSNPLLLQKLYVLGARTGTDVGLSELRAANKKYPNNLDLRTLLSRYLTRLKRFEEANTLWRDFVPNNTTPNFYFTEQEEIQLALNNTDQLSELYEKWVSLKGDQFGAWIKAIIHFSKSNNQARTTSLINQIKKQNFNPNEVTALVAQAYFNLGDIDAASDELSNVSSSFQQSKFVKQLSAKVFYEKGDYTSSLAMLESGVVQPLTDDLALLKSFNLERMGQTNQSQAFLRQHIGQNPEHHLSKLHLANGLLSTAPSEAQQYLQEILQVQPKNVIALNNLSWLLLQRGELALAERYSKQAVSLVPLNPFILHTAALISQQKGDLQIALELARTASKLAPENENIRRTFEQIRSKI